MLLLLVDIKTFYVTLCALDILLLKHCYFHIYSKCIYPIGNKIDWIIPYHIHNQVVLLLKTRCLTRINESKNSFWWKG